jgi:hypothetical protein
MNKPSRLPMQVEGQVEEGVEMILEVVEEEDRIKI